MRDIASDTYIVKFEGNFFQTKLVSRLLHKVCRLFSSPVLWRDAFTANANLNLYHVTKRPFTPVSSTRIILVSFYLHISYFDMIFQLEPDVKFAV